MRLSVSISLRNLYYSLESIKEISELHSNPCNVTFIQVCQPCNRLCITCSGPGTVNCPKCRYYRYSDSVRYSNCVEKCPSYTSPSKTDCKRCHSQCLKGCNGPNNTHCMECQNFKIVINNDKNNYTVSGQSKKKSTVMCLSIGTPKYNQFSICSKWKIYYF